MSERCRVMDYLNDRIVEAFNQGDDEDARDLNNFLNSLELMTDSEYDKVYGPDYVKVD